MNKNKLTAILIATFLVVNAILFLSGSLLKSIYIQYNDDYRWGLVSVGIILSIYIWLFATIVYFISLAEEIGTRAMFAVLLVSGIAMLPFCFMPESFLPIISLNSVDPFLGVYGIILSIGFGLAFINWIFWEGKGIRGDTI